MSMFCYQCQEALKGEGCTNVGVCGKSAATATVQDVTIYALKGLAYYASLLRANNKKTNDVAPHIINGLFMTITNANFDDDAFYCFLKTTMELKKELATQAEDAGLITDAMPDAAKWSASTNAEFDAKKEEASVLAQKNEDIRSLIELIVYGLKGACAYAEHAYNLGFRDEKVDNFIVDTLAYLLKTDLTVDDLVAKTLETGECGVSAMALLDKANTTAYGNPEITEVSIGVRSNPGILISGHDLHDIAMLLEQTKGTGVDVYTHSEMLPAHYYPAFKKYDHFAGNYGNAWWQQVEEFESFNGPVIFTSNCIVPPRKSSTYSDKIFTTNASGFPGFKHIKADENGKKDFSEVISLAKTCKAPTEIETGKIVGGFAHNQVLALADKVVTAVKEGAIKKFVVMAGCDGRHKTRSYYTEFAEKLPNDAVILTAGCAKYRYNKLNLGDIGGIPRVLDAGQCNDSYSLAVIALKLKEVFELDDINKLPIVYNIAWYEQKAVIVLLALLFLGVKNIHLGPTLPAFLSPNVAKVLVENFGIGGITTVDDDLKAMIG